MKSSLDKGILLAIFFLMGLGLVQVYSSSYIHAIETYGDGLFFFRKQLAFAALSVLVLLATAFVPPKWAPRLAYALWIVALVGIIATFLPGIAIKAGGAHRWVNLPFGQRFEPAELLRVTFPFVVAWALTFEKRILGVLDRPLRLLAVATPLVFVLQQPDFGTFVICTMIAMILVFTNGLQWKYVISSVIVFAVSAYFLIISQPYRMARIKSFLDPWSDPAEKGFQVIQSMLSFHSGRLWGVGMGQGQGKLFFLPEAHTDFTLAVFGEEMGFIGFVIVLMLFGFLMFRGIQIAMRANDNFSRLTAIGLTAAQGLSVFINVGVVTGMLPTKGLTMPFLSYGGSSLLCTCLAYGLLLNLERGQAAGNGLSSPSQVRVKSGVRRL